MGTMMGRKIQELSPLVVSRLKEPGLHFVGGVAGLALQVSKSGARSWILRATVGAKRRDIGLGGFPDVPLASAKDQARIAREKIRNGIDPVAEKQAIKSALIAAEGQSITFERSAEMFIKAKESEWSNIKHAAQWRSTLETYAYPKIGNLLVRDVLLLHVLAILEPIWKTKTETASRLRGRLESVLDWATVRGYRIGENPARWRGHLEHQLAKPSKVAKVEHHPALPYVEIGDFMTALRGHQGMGAKALEFAILTATRSGEVRGARWAEIDLKTALWTIPAERMKAKKEHRIPLSAAAVSLIKKLPRIDADFVFPGSKNGSTISDMTMSAVLKRMSVDAVPHGFRSTFRDWAAERTNYPRDAAEMALAHTIGDKVEAAYRRGDLFEKRRRMMADWAAFCAAPSFKAGKVISLHNVA
ncbi:MAG TPA: integrase arm-type DNA-binding domain-containing protein [Gallionella sp.]|nr:integrase arm-type DNA-binding domain-containing protein [Gallionella sp.]